MKIIRNYASQTTRSAAAMLFLLFLAGCGKDYTCSCSRSWVNPLTNVPGHDVVTSTIHGSKNAATQKCRLREDELDPGASGSATCKLN